MVKGRFNADFNADFNTESKIDFWVCNMRMRGYDIIDILCSEQVVIYCGEANYLCNFL